jgi:ribonuclease Z
MVRRDFLKETAATGVAGMATAGQALAQAGGQMPGANQGFEMRTSVSQPELFYYPGEELAKDEIRVSVMGSGWGSIVRKRQAGCSLFIELGNGDSFVWDMGQGTLVNYNTMQVPYSRMSRVFLTHLHMDHTTDVLPLYAFGPAGDRFTPLRIWGPSGDGRTMGVKHMMETGLKAYANWHVTSFRTTLPGTSTSNGGYGLEVIELDYKRSGGLAYNENSVKITYWPALHIIDGAIGYRLDWNGMSVCWSGDTNPGHFFVDNCKNVDLLFHETAPTPSRLVAAAGFTKSVAEAVVANSHTPARALGKILQLTKPKLGVTVHCPVDPQDIGRYVEDVRVYWSGPYQLVTEDLFVFNVSKSKNTVTVRQAAVNERAWSPVIQTPATGSPMLPLDNYRKSGLWASQIRDY